MLTRNETLRAALHDAQVAFVGACHSVAVPARSGSEDGHGNAPCGSPPLSNTGGTEMAVALASLATTETVSLVVTDTGEVKQVMVRKPANDQCAAIDCLRITLGAETWSHTAGRPLVADEEFIVEASIWLEEIFGFGITSDLHKQRDFYLNSWCVGDNFGLVAFGGAHQRDTMLIVLHGSGCAAAKPGWEARLHSFLTKLAKRPVITRVDLAHDCFEGDRVNVDLADDWYDLGLFNLSARRPSHERRGDWKNRTGEGLTLYVGKRKNGKVCRIYEKGREQGDALSPWVRVEVEFRNTDRVIPFDVLMNPSTYFAGAYPAMQLLAKDCSETRIACKAKAAEINIEACMAHIKRTYGKHINVGVGFYGVEEFIAKVRSDSDQWPERLKVPEFELSPVPIHRNQPESGPTYLVTPVISYPGERAFLSSYQ